MVLRERKIRKYEARHKINNYEYKKEIADQH